MSGETTQHAQQGRYAGQLLFKQESYRIVGACFEVYKDKGNGFLEGVYHECLSIEFERQNVPFISKPKLELEYKGQKLGQAYEPDFLCFSEIIVEIKAVRTLTDEHRAQAINYLKATGKCLALLINFGSYRAIEHERFINHWDK